MAGRVVGAVPPTVEPRAMIEHGRTAVPAGSSAASRSSQPARIVRLCGSPDPGQAPARWRVAEPRELAHAETFVRVLPATASLRSDMSPEPVPENVAAPVLDTDPAFALHRGGKIETRDHRAAAQPRRPLAGLHAGRRPGLHGDRRRARARRRLHLAGQHRRRRHRRHRGARPRRHRPGRRAAGDGGQGAAVQALRRGRRGADLPRLHRRRRALRDRRAARAELRRHQPRGHLRAALLRARAPAAGARSTSRSSTTTSTAPRSSCWPRCATPPS